MAYATATEAANIPKQDTLQSIVANFDPLLNRLDSLIGRAATCGDRIAGQRPESVGNGEKHPEPNHLIWALQSRRDRLAKIIDVLENEMSRIEQGL